MSRSIENTSVLVTRPLPQADRLCELIESEGGKAIKMPLLSVEALPESDVVLEKLLSMTDFNVGIFISQNAAFHTLKILHDQCSLLKNLQVIAIGEETAGILKQAGITDVIYPEKQSSSEQLLELGILQPENINGRKVIIFRGEGGRELLARELQKRGALVEYLEVYRRSSVHYDRNAIEDICNRQRPDCIVITSGESLQNLFDMLSSEQKDYMFSLPMIVLSKRVASMAEKLGARMSPVITRNTSDQGIVSAIKSIHR